MDLDWSAFAHYNRAYCTIQRKGHDYIRRAIDDLNAALCKLETYKQNFMFLKYTSMHMIMIMMLMMMMVVIYLIGDRHSSIS